MTIDHRSSVETFLRAVQSMAFCFHGLLGILENFTGCVKGVFGDDHLTMPQWFWPVAGLLLWTMAALNWSPNPVVVLCAQTYICAFHMGGFFYHQRLGHLWVLGLLPAAIAVVSFVIVGIRIQSFGLALVGWVACTILAHQLSKVLVKPPPSTESSELSPASNLLSS